MEHVLDFIVSVLAAAFIIGALCPMLLIPFLASMALAELIATLATTRVLRDAWQRIPGIRRVPRK